MSKAHIYIAIDLKSFYASVECVARELNPLTTNLVVADASRTDKTICLAVTPSLKAYGISGRPRLFEVVQKVREINKARLAKAKGKRFLGKSNNSLELQANNELELDYIIAPPRMAEYLRKSVDIYKVYLHFFAKNDIHIYSIDEVFIDVSNYLQLYSTDAEKLTMQVIEAILEETGITATAGIGTNMYLAKIAMDIVAKHLPGDARGVRIAALDEVKYRKLLWNHKPLTDFWRIGKGYSEKLEKNGLLTMGDIARCSLGGKRSYYNAELLYKLFGVNAELLIDHAWGYEPCTLDMVKSYIPKARSLNTGQVLSRPYTYSEGKLIVQEMADLLVLDLVEKGLLTNQLVLHIGYDIENVAWNYQGKIIIDSYGRSKPVHAQGTVNLAQFSSSTRLIVENLLALYTQIVDEKLLIRRVNITACNVIGEEYVHKQYEQLDLFQEYAALEKQDALEQSFYKREKQWQKVILYLQERYGKNAVLKGINYLEGAKTRERNEQIGGHKA